VTNKTKCPVCEKVTVSESARDGKNDLNYVDCSNCGRYALGGIAQGVLSSGWAGNKQVLAHWIRKRANINNPPFVLNEFLELVRTVQLPSAHEQRDNLLTAIGDSLKHPGERIEIDADRFQAITGTATPQSLEWLLQEFLNAKIVSGAMMGIAGDDDFVLDGATLTLDGWTQYFELKRSDKQSRLAFMAMPFKFPELTNVFESCFVPAVKRAGFELRRVIDNQGAGLVDDQIRVGIRRSRFVVCELAEQNQGAYWEAGFAEGIGLPVIYTCRDDEFKKIHFDTSHLVTVRWDPTNLESAGRDLTAKIRATLPMEAKMED